MLRGRKFDSSSCKNPYVIEANLAARVTLRSSLYPHLWAAFMLRKVSLPGLSCNQQEFSIPQEPIIVRDWREFTAQN